jgi:hypothetical protein
VSSESVQAETAGAPKISVAVPASAGALRLRWLLNALEEQTLDAESWELIVGHDGLDPSVTRLVQGHPLATAGILRDAQVEAGAGPAAKRNAAWRVARGPSVLFTVPECRPPRDWVERALHAATGSAAAVVLGTIIPDPEEWRAKLAPHRRTCSVLYPGPSAGALCGVFPRPVLEQLGGFDASLPRGDGIDLVLRAEAAGVAVEAAPELSTWHAIEELSIARALRAALGARHWAELLRRHRTLRRDLALGSFPGPRQAWLPVAMVGLARSRRSTAWLVAALPWLMLGPGYLPSTPGDWARATSRLPGRFLVDLVETISLGSGLISGRRRSP